MDRKIAEAFAAKHNGNAVEAILDAVAAARQGDRENELLLEALDSAGVENWDGWDNAQELFFELLREDEEGDDCDDSN